MDNEEIIASFATSMERRDQEPNKQLASRLAVAGDESCLNILVALATGKNSKLANDALHTLGFLAEIRPKWVSAHLPVLLSGLSSPNNRSVWATMILLSYVVAGNEKFFYTHLPEILQAMDRGTVITRDHGIKILVALYADETYRDDAFTLFLEQLTSAPDNQAGQYAERILPVLKKEHYPRVIEILSHRMQEFTHDSHVKRAARLIRVLQNDSLG